MEPKECLSSSSSGISMNDFLEFLKITCQVNDSIGTGNRAPPQDIDYNNLANNSMINGLLEAPTKDNTSPHAADNDSSNSEKKTDKGRRRSSTTLITKPSKPKSDCATGKNINPALSAKLDEVINEGILDSVLPFICPAPSAVEAAGVYPVKPTKIKIGEHIANTNLKPAQPEGDKKEDGIHTSKSPRHEGTIKVREGRMPRRKSVVQCLAMSDDKKAETEVVIHVCDEVKNTSKDFSCPQHLLVSKMGYFADVTAGQKLEDMDISVHCDIQIFEWLMKWVKKDPNQTENWPQLDAANVVPILVSASFLQMEPLLLDCLSFCHSRLNEVVRASTNLSCLNDSIITRLAAMFTNLELEMVKDKKERVTPRLWMKLIQSLFEPEPQALRGHYFTLAGLFRCSKCGKYLTQSASSYIGCTPANMRLNRWGQLLSQHSRDTSWQITNYVAVLFKELKSWRKVYWKLWGHCHYLYCCICETYFPAYQMNWCQYHPEAPQFLGPITEGRIAGPAGRYPCCGQQAFRYETLPGPNGCGYREHSVQVETDRDRAILALAQIAAEGNCLYESPPIKPGATANSEPRWVGMSLMPTKCRQGLLPPLHVDEHNNRISRRIRQGAACFIDSSSETDTSEPRERRYTHRQLSTSSDGCESETNSPKQFRRNSKRRQTKASGRYWSGEMSARSNQDNQRDFEERVMKQVVSMVGKKTGCDVNVPYTNYHIGGSYIRLESEWKEQIRQKNFNKQKLSK